MRLESGAFVKDYEDANKEVEQAVQMSVPEVVSEDPRFMERAPPPLSEEFPDGSRIFFLGEHAYGVAAQVSGTTEDSLSVVLAVRCPSPPHIFAVSDPSLLQFSPSDKSENEKFKSVVMNRLPTHYYPAFTVAEMLHISSRAISRITSSFMVLTSDNQKVNLGLSLKFEGKGQKVLEYSKKDGKFWEFSDKAVGLLREYRVRVFCFLVPTSGQAVKCFVVL